MKRRSKLAILICLLILAGGAAVWHWPSREASLVAKAKTLRKGMTQEQVKAVLGQPSDTFGVCEDCCLIYSNCYVGGHDISRLVSAQPPFVHPLEYWMSRRWSLSAEYEPTSFTSTFAFTSTCGRKLAKVTYYPDSRPGSAIDIPIP